MEKFVKLVNGKISVIEPDITKSDIADLFNAVVVNNNIFNAQDESDVELAKDLCYLLANEAYRMISENPRLSKILSVRGVVSAMQSQEVQGYENIFPIQEIFTQLRQELPWDEFKELVDKA